MGRNDKLATMKMVASKSGCSIATVSHVINSTRYVSPETRKIVEDTIQQLSYTPNNLARSLTRSSSSSIGLVFGQKANPYFFDMFGAIQTECFKAGFCVIVGDSEENTDRELEILKDFHKRRVDGVIIAPTVDPDQRVYQYLQDNDMNTVLVDRLDFPQFNQVGMDNEQAVFELVDHMVGHGHKKIGFIPGRSDSSTTFERKLAFKKRTKHHGIFEGCIIADCCNNLDEASNRVSALLKLQGSDACTALITGNNLATIGAVRATREMNISIPKDIKLVGVDDFDWADYFDPQLTLVAQPCSQIGKIAAEYILSRITDSTCNATTTRLPPELKIRKSCGC